MNARARSRAWLSEALAVWLVVGLGLIAYRAAPGGGFQLDDVVRIVDDAAVRLDTLSWSALARAAERYPTRPIAMASLAIDWWRGGGAPRAFLLTNLIVHALNGVLVFVFLTLLLLRWRPRGAHADRRLAATLGAALWIAHPLASQGVVYIVQRMTSMAATGVLMAAIGYILFRTRGGRSRWAGLAVGMLGAAIGWWSKESAWILPLLLILVEYGVVRQPPLWHRAGRADRAVYVIVAAAALYVAVDLILGGPLFVRFDSGYDRRPFSMLERVLTQPRVIFSYLSLFLYPAPGRLSIEHDVVVSTSLLAPPTTILALAAIVAWGAGSLVGMFRPRWRPWSFLALWPLTTLAIESGVVPLELVFEHRMYLPMVGLVGIVSLGALTGLEHAPTGAVRSAAIAVAAVIVIALAQLTHARVQMWNDPMVLWSSALNNAPDSSRARVFVAAAHMDQRRYREAERLLLEAIGLDENNVFAFVKLGVVYTFTNRLPLAVHAFEGALRLDPDRAEAHANLGFAYLGLGRVDEAIVHLERAAAAKPWDAPAQLNLGIAYKKKGWLDRANAAFERARRLKEEVVDLRNAGPRMP